MFPFIFHFANFFGGQNFIIFLQKKKKKKKEDFAAARLATMSATRWTGNKRFLIKGGLNAFYLPCLRKDVLCKINRGRISCKTYNHTGGNNMFINQCSSNLPSMRLFSCDSLATHIKVIQLPWFTFQVVFATI